MQQDPKPDFTGFAKGLYENKLCNIAAGFLLPNKAEKRSNAMCLASSDNEVWQ
jgi:hypothetical protein